MAIHDTTAQNSVPSAPQPIVNSEDDKTHVPRNLKIAVVGAAIALAVLGFLAGLNSGTTAGALGRAFGTALQPVIPAAIIGWGNERRARIVYLVVAAIVVVLNLGSL